MRTLEPFVPIPEDVIPEMLQLASLRPGELLVDLGSGDGRIVFTAAERFGARAVGVEARETLVRECRRKAREMGLTGAVRFVRSPFKDYGLGKADVLALYLSSYTLGLLERKFTRELRKGTRIVTFEFQIFGWKPRLESSFTPKRWTKPHPIYLYVV